MRSLIRFALATFHLPKIAARLAGLIGLLALVACLFCPWFSVPFGADAGAGRIVVEQQTDPIAWLFRGLAAVIIVVAVMFVWKSPEWPRRCETLFVGWWVALLFFPYCISVWCPAIAGEASWLQGQHESLTSPSGDIYLSQERRDTVLRNKVSVVNQPIGSEVARFPEGGLRRLTWGRIAEASEWFGMSGWWSTFLRRGWVFAMIGTTLILGALCRENNDGSLAAALRVLRHGAGATVAVASLALLPIAGAWILLDQAKGAAQRGDNRTALHALTFAARLLPSVREDGYFVLQKGLLENTLEMDTAEAEFYRATLLEEQGFRLQAEDAYLTILSDPELPRALHREAAKSLLRRATNAFNSGEINAASGLLNGVLSADPCNLNANHALQLACLRRGDLAELNRLRDLMKDTYQYFNTPGKESPLADASENLAIGYYSVGDLSAATKAWREARR
jgi:hypothetical protein